MDGRVSQSAWETPLLHTSFPPPGPFLAQGVGGAEAGQALGHPAATLPTALLLHWLRPTAPPPTQETPRPICATTKLGDGNGRGRPGSSPSLGRLVYWLVQVIDILVCIPVSGTRGS